MGLFAEYQPKYAALGIATFPVDPLSKKPLVRNPQLFGLRGSAELVAKFPDADCFGFWAGPHSCKTVIDLDTSDELFLAATLTRFGDTPLIVRSASRKGFHLYYANAGEARKIRLDRQPLDVLGKGLVILPPSRTPKGEYTIVKGSLEDLRTLPKLRRDALKTALQDSVACSHGPKIHEGNRDNEMFRFSMRQAKLGVPRDTLIRDARAYNEKSLVPPLEDSLVVAKVDKAIAYTAAGKNTVSEPYVILRHDQVDQLAAQNPYALALLAMLRRKHWGREFVIANTWAKTLKWPLPRLQEARASLVRFGHVRLIRRHTKNSPAVYDWPS